MTEHITDAEPGSAHMPDITVEQDVFVESPALESDHDFLFPGDKGQLSYDARRVFALLLQRRFIEASEDSWAWQTILKHQNDLESRFHDMFLELVVDREYAVAYKKQVRQEELNIPILLRDDSYKRAETLALVYLRSTFRQQVSMGAGAAFVDHDELLNHAMSFFASDETNLALRHREANAGIEQLAREGILKEASEGRYRISPIIEVLMPIDRIKELTQWINTRLVSEPSILTPVSPITEDPLDEDVAISSADEVGASSSFEDEVVEEGFEHGASNESTEISAQLNFDELPQEQD